MPPRPDSSPPLDENTPVKTNMKTLVAVGAVLVIGAVGWANLKSDVGSHSLTLADMQQVQRADHDLLIRLANTAEAQGKAVEAQGKVLNYLANDRRGPRPLPVPETTQP